jgi:DNA-binding protein HU-beta
MTKEELVSMMASEAEISKVKAEKAFKALISGISGALKNGDSVTIVGFGTFTVADRAARRARNPQTGQEMIIPAKRSPKFRPGKTLKEAVK